jgi:putative sigma-54 modulation protein
MQITVTGRHFEITEPLRQHVETKTAKLGRYTDSISDVHVVLSVEKHRHLAEITLQANGTPIRGLEEKHDMYQAFDTVIEKIERQVKRLKERGSKRKGRTGSKEVSTMIEAETIAEERIEAEPSSQPRVIRSPKMAVKPMSVDEAAMQMGLSDAEFLAFLNSETDQMNVMYKRRDGNYGLIEPEF